MLVASDRCDLIRVYSALADEEDREHEMNDSEREKGYSERNSIVPPRAGRHGVWLILRKQMIAVVVALFVIGLYFLW